MERLFFRKSQRLAKEEDFTRVLSRKCFVCKGMLRLYRAENALDLPRFGVSVSKSCGSAVVRNRLKRLGREVFRLHQHEIRAGFDYILIFTAKEPNIQSKAGQAGAEMTYDDVKRAFLTMIRSLDAKQSCRRPQEE